jgi:GxxExxY protein
METAITMDNNKRKWAIIRAMKAAGAGDDTSDPATGSDGPVKPRRAKAVADAPKKPRGRPKKVVPEPAIVVPDDVAEMWETMKSLAEEVYRELGAGHTESVYHNAMKIGLHDSRLAFETERDLPIKFRGRYVGTARADLVIDGRLVVELKITGKLEDAEDQCRQYMVLTGIRRGMVILFPKDGGVGVQIRSVS